LALMESEHSNLRSIDAMRSGVDLEKEKKMVIDVLLLIYSNLIRYVYGELMEWNGMKRNIICTCGVTRGFMRGYDDSFVSFAYISQYIRVFSSGKRTVLTSISGNELLFLCVIRW
jgi:hypothetical protein